MAGGLLTQAFSWRAIFLVQVLLTRVFSVTLFHHFAFAAISVAMLGLAWNVKVPSLEKIAQRRIREPALEADLQRQEDLEAARHPPPPSRRGGARRRPAM